MLHWLKRVWNKETGGLTAAAMIIGVSSVGSRLLGIVRDRVLAGQFGASRELDVYYAAFRLPDTIYALVILGALSAGCIPLLSEVLEKKGEKQAQAFASSVFVLFGMVLVLFSSALALFAPMIVPAVFKGFTTSEYQQLISLTRIMAWSPILLGLSSVAGSVLQVTKRYVMFALAPMLYNLGIILFAMLFVKRFGVMALGYGVVAGAFAHAFLQIKAITALGYLRTFDVRVFPSEWKQLLVLTGPRLFGLGVSQVSLTLMTAFAAMVGAGSISALQFATNIQSFPLGVFGLSIAMAAFPLLAHAQTKQDDKTFRDVFSQAARQLLFFLVPSAAIFFLFRAQLVRLILGQGQFGWSDTIMTADALGILAMALVAQAFIPLFTRAFYAMQNTWLPFIVALLGEGVTIGIAWWGLPQFGLHAITWAIVVGSWSQLLLQAGFLRQRFGSYVKGESFVSAYKTIIATIAFCLAAFPLREYIGIRFPLRQTWQIILQIIVPCLGGGIAFIVVANLIKSQEYAEVYATVKRKLWRTKEAKQLDEESIIM